MEPESLKDVEHHRQLELCTTRPAYRQGRKLTAVKVYTINSESQHLFIYGVPKINLRSELKHLCSKYGQIITIHVITDHKTEIFTECYHVQYNRIQSAKIAKRLLDNKSFYGGVLHVCYAPEYESIEETRTKLLQRNKDVLSRIENPDNLFTQQQTASTEIAYEDYTKLSKSQIRKKRKYEELPGKYKNISEDPLEPCSKNLKPIEDSVCAEKPASAVTEYGPHASDYQLFITTEENAKLNTKRVSSLIPTQVHKTLQTKVVKRIVFKNKGNRS